MGAKQAVMDPVSEKIFGAVLVSASSAAITYLVASFKKASNDDLKQLKSEIKEQQQGLALRIARLEDRGENLVTRAEFQKTVDDLKTDLKQTLNELKAELVAFRHLVMKKE